MCHLQNIRNIFHYDLETKAVVYQLELNIPVSVAWGDKEYFYSPLGGMLFHHRATHGIKSAGAHLYTRRKQHNVPTRARTRTTWHWDKHTSHDALQFPNSSPLKFCKIVFSGVEFCAEFEVALQKQVLPVNANRLK